MHTFGTTRSYNFGTQTARSVLRVSGAKASVRHSIKWADNGQMVSQISYTLGRPNGDGAAWYPDGNKKCRALGQTVQTVLL